MPELDKKCAPSKKYKDGSCFTENALKKIAIKFNEKNKDKIDINQGKEGLLKDLKRKITDCKGEQVCWLRLDMVKELRDDDILHNTFRPKGPTGKYEWLNTNHINQVIEQYHTVHKDFIFLGAVPSDFEELEVLGIGDLNFADLEKQGKTKIGLVINLDEHNQSGSHWVGLYTDLKKNQIYYFDSVGQYPKRKKIRKFINRLVKYLYNKKYNEDIYINKLLKKDNNKYYTNLINGNFDIRYNDIQHQFDNSECGVYSINFIVRLVEGESFDSVTKNIIRDEKMNEKRKEYFLNVN